MFDRKLKYFSNALKGHFLLSVPQHLYHWLRQLQLETRWLLWIVGAGDKCPGRQHWHHQPTQCWLLCAGRRCSESDFEGRNHLEVFLGLPYSEFWGWLLPDYWRLITLAWYKQEMRREVFIVLDIKINICHSSAKIKIGSSNHKHHKTWALFTSYNLINAFYNI